ncbi:phosphopantetheine-binding protein [Streptomyces sp. NPDC088729]|uniref:phosphopantetheine-binding protein n=1 Tax=unclassified Streptomyces TaxID=2593676 RepID=UPI0013DD92CD|nr:phosphopantetheine-binding protein [Streptomyces sp. ADI96-02]
MDEIMRSVAEAVRHHSARADAPASLPDADAPLKEAGLDSLALVGLLSHLEEHFAVFFPDRMLTRETFHSVRTVAEAVRELRGEG